MPWFYTFGLTVPVEMSIRMHDDEIDLLMSSGLLKMKNWKQYEYSRAWVPIEVPKGEEVGTSIIERPPNKDR